jgi:signal transduction histidine kinase
MLARLRFDLHDGPQQDVILLAEDLRLFRAQLDTVLSCDERGALVLGRCDDLEARLVALEGDLRRISASLESPFPRRESLPHALARVAGVFEERSGIKPLVHQRGDFGNLTDSQRITLLCLIREALANIDEHARAKHVRISVSAAADGVRASVTDDGRGFDPETMLVKAARHGHLGLVGMHERVRMLGGRTQIDSRPGGPTVISVSLPRTPVCVPDPVLHAPGPDAPLWSSFS